MTQFQAMAAIMNSKDARELLKSNLSKLRNKVVFHFDIAEIGRQLKNLEISDPVFVSAVGTTNEQAYHELADLCALRTFSGSAFPNDKRGLEIMGDLMRRTTDVTLRFLTAAEEFIKTVLERGGWQFVTIPEPCSP